MDEPFRIYRDAGVVLTLQGCTAGADYKTGRPFLENLYRPALSREAFVRMRMIDLVEYEDDLAIRA